MRTRTWGTISGAEGQTQGVPVRCPNTVSGAFKGKNKIKQAQPQDSSKPYLRVTLSLRLKDVKQRWKALRGTEVHSRSAR